MLKEWRIIKTKGEELQYYSNQINLSSELIMMLILAEDHRFNSHFGVDARALIRAIWRVSTGARIEGGSTIAMQLVRVLTGRYEKTICRKITEIIFAIAATRKFGKSNIPKMYLSVAYYGWGMNGINAASARMDVNLKKLTPQQAAEIIARLKYPESKNNTKEKALKIKTRVDHILHLYYQK